MSVTLSDQERSFLWDDGCRAVRFASGAVAEAPSLVGAHGFAGYALISTKRALEDRQVESLATGAAVVIGVPSGSVPDAAAAVRDEARRRPLVALGGGRVIDVAKAIAAADELSCAAVPTTLSGAEMTRIHRLPAGVSSAPHGLVRPRLAVCDPQLMASQPTEALAASAMNALAHGAEALYGQRASALSELAAVRGAALIAGGLGEPDHRRDALALGSVLCAWALDALDGAGLGLHHAVCQTIVRLLGTPHAQTNAVMLPHVLRYVGAHAPREIAALGRALGADAGGPEAVAERVRRLAAPAGVSRLGELGVKSSAIGAVVEAVMRRPEPAATPGSPGAVEVGELLQRAL